jgi:hypothetical protein
MSENKSITFFISPEDRARIERAQQKEKDKTGYKPSIATILRNLIKKNLR